MTILYEEELMQASGYTRRGDLERCLRSQGIPVYTGRDGRVFVITDIRPANETTPDEIKIDTHHGQKQKTIKG